MKIMRLRHAKLIIILIVLANLVLFYYTWKSVLWKSIVDPGDESGNNQLQKSKTPQTAKDKIKTANKHIRKSITIVFRTFYTFENDIKASIDSILEIVPNIPILVVQDTLPYPPVTYETNLTEPSTVRFLNLGFDIQKSSKEMNPLLAIKTKYVLFMPDSVRLNNKNLLQKILKEINNSHREQVDGVGKVGVGGGGGGGGNGGGGIVDSDDIVRRVVIVPFAGNIKSFSSCTQVNLDLPNWTIQYIAVNSSDKCDLYLQKHAILVDTGVLREMPDPFGSPFPELFYIQAKAAKIEKTIFPNAFQDGRRLFASYHTKQRRMENRRRQFKEMYKKLQIKRIVKRSHKITSKTDLKESLGPSHNLVLDGQFSSSNFSLPQATEIDLIGCERTSKSCVGPVYNMKPFYVYLNKHTPPCCLDKLKTTFNHVLEEFENVGIRYWLDNYALKTAIETNNLSPDAYDIDISFNVFDLERSNSLKKSQTKPFIDNEGFYWMKATDGHYFRVQFSKINQIGLNLLPFEISGNIVKPNAFFGWKAKEFSGDYLHPMSTVLFLGKNIQCPNNVREYLEFKNIK
ncbi:ribitol 5-phosphate transferase FKRP [Eupeodes corollae]|uniref:ribitol 5-phosphate transferase FKRP n=1 Tax=Eupeodes corollae TaxID=290404 RepID=UPI0024927EF4|nr:ribitol 5-phosphate transferase FKRP [Eupeodes corollae]